MFVEYEPRIDGRFKVLLEARECVIDAPVDRIYSVMRGLVVALDYLKRCIPDLACRQGEGCREVA